MPQIGIDAYIQDFDVIVKKLQDENMGINNELSFKLAVQIQRNMILEKRLNEISNLLDDISNSIPF